MLVYPKLLSIDSEEHQALHRPLLTVLRQAICRGGGIVVGNTAILSPVYGIVHQRVGDVEDVGDASGRGRRIAFP